MLVVVQNVEQEFTKSGAEYRKVTGTTGDGKQTTKNVFDNLSDKWELLIEGAPLEFTMEKKGQFWNVVDIKSVEMPEAKTPQTPPPQKGEPTSEELHPIAPQELGMWYKEIGEMYRAGKLNPKENPRHHALMMAYWGRLYYVLDIKEGKEE